MSDLLAARAQMGTSLAFHIIFASLGIGLPLLLCLAEGLALRQKDSGWMTLTRRWTKAFALLFAIGAVSGTILSFEIGLLWLTFTRFSGAIIGLPFALEGFAFFIEAIFLGLYLYGWERLSPLAHWLCSFPLWISGAASAWFIVSANSWMNTPTGFQITHGQVTGINPLQAIFNPSTPYETTHMLLAAYVATGFGVAAVYALQILRGKRESYYRKGLVLAMALGAIAIPLQIFDGDLSARSLADLQPAKLAAMEGVFHTEQGAPIKIGGIVDDKTGQVQYALEIPDLLSILARGDPHATIRGLDTYAPQDWPDPFFVHPSFDGMVGSGFFALFIGGLFWLLYFKRKRVVPENRLVLWGIVLAGPLSFIAIELGWMVTELGRQPWVIYGILRTSDAVTTAPGLGISFAIFSGIYVVLAITPILLLLRLARSPLPRQEWPVLASSSEERVGTK
jgi:cytochrome d ubiquinol oxidase subunit I